MDTGNRHPLEIITKNNSLSMLEALIPFVDYPLKLPLALLIKWNEIRLIINAFHSLNNLSGMGLHQPTKDPFEMLCGMAGISPDMLKMLMSTMENNKNGFSPELFSQMSGGGAPDLSSMTNLFGQNEQPEPFTAEDTFSYNDSPAYAEKDFDARIQSILTEYDLSQAEQLSAANFSSQSDMENPEVTDIANITEMPDINIDNNPIS